MLIFFILNQMDNKCNRYSLPLTQGNLYVNETRVHTPAPYPTPTPKMSPPRRLAVLHSHLRPEGPAPPAGRGENELTEGQEAAVSTSPCAVAGDDSRSAAAGPVGDGELETCVFCRIIRDEAPAFKVGRALSSSSQFVLAASVACSGLGWAVLDTEGINYMGASSTHPKIVASHTHTLTPKFAVSESGR
jgi:hypothetical protein